MSYESPHIHLSKPCDPVVHNADTASDTHLDMCGDIHTHKGVVSLMERQLTLLHAQLTNFGASANCSHTHAHTHTHTHA